MTDALDRLTGRRGVREYLIRPLVEDGLQRARGVKVEEHEAFLEKLVEKLAYCDPETLDRLRPMVLGMATGPAANVWPSYATIRNLAHTLQAPPDTSDETLKGWLRSVAGLDVRRRGTLLATRAYIKHFRKPPVIDGRINRFLLDKIAAKQREIDLEMARVRDSVADKRATEAERAWLAEMEATRAELEALVAEGERHRAEKAEAAE